MLYNVGSRKEVDVMGDRKRTLSNVLFTTGMSQLLSSTLVTVSGSEAVYSRQWVI